MTDPLAATIHSLFINQAYGSDLYRLCFRLGS